MYYVPQRQAELKVKHDLEARELALAEEKRKLGMTD